MNEKMLKDFKIESEFGAGRTSENKETIIKSLKEIEGQIKEIEEEIKKDEEELGRMLEMKDEDFLDDEDRKISNEYAKKLREYIEKNRNILEKMGKLKIDAENLLEGHAKLDEMEKGILENMKPGSIH